MMPRIASAPICAGCRFTSPENCAACTEDYALAQQRVQAGVCDGACQEHVGPVRLVRVSSQHGGNDWGWWAYCAAAIQADRANHLQITEHGGDHVALHGRA